MINHSKINSLPLSEFGRDAVALVFAANDYYVPYLSTMLESVMKNAADDRHYDLIVLNTDISERNREILSGQLVNSRVSLRFLDISPDILNWDNLFVRGHFKVETYYRLLLQEILPEHSKVLYLDSDMVALADVSELFDVDLDGYLVAAVQDPDTAGLYNGYLPKKKNYIDNVMRMSDPYAYFQAGTVLFNLDEFRRCYSVDEIFEYALSYDWELLDQDVLNHFCEGKVKYVDMAWNVMMDMWGEREAGIIALAPEDLRSQYSAAKGDPRVAHYAGPQKPWLYPDCDMAEYFWLYARSTPYYETILARMTDAVAKRSAGEASWAAIEEFQATLRAEEAERLANTAPQKLKRKVRQVGEVALPQGTARRKIAGGAYRRLKFRNSTQ